MNHPAEAVGHPVLRSLRFRLLAATVVGVSVALLLAGLALSGLFRQHVLEQFQLSLIQQLDHLTGKLDFDADGRPILNAKDLPDPRWQHPYSGLYWQVDWMDPAGDVRAGVSRSRSLWDSELRVAADALVFGAVHAHEVTGPQDHALLLVERLVRPPGQGGGAWRLMVAGDLQETHNATAHFSSVLGVSMAVLLALLAAAAWAQVAVGLRPLRALQGSLQAVQRADTARLEGAFPTEIQPLVSDFNRVLDQSQQVVERARTQAGNLAHALKTPLSVLDQAAQRAASVPTGELAHLVQEQVAVARRHIDWHLAQARASASQRLPGQRTDVAQVLNGLVRVMQRVHAERDMDIAVHMPAEAVYFAGEEQDLQEILGNLLDNACKWAHRHVTVSVRLLPDGAAPELRVEVADDGPGIAAELRSQVLNRGVRLDESVAGTGLGLAIVKDLVTLYGGTMALDERAGGGLCASVHLPAI